jgi:hypothetical protein
MQDPRHAETIDVSGLLTIDVASELRKLSQAQLQGPWQLPAELVRRAFRSGAREIQVTTMRRGVRVVDDGWGYGVEALRWAMTLLDGRRSNEERHAALTALESSGELVLLAMAGLHVELLRIETVHDGVHAKLELAAGRPPRFEEHHGVAGRWTDLVLRAGGLDRRQVVSWLRSVARFAPGSLTIDGHPVQSGFAAPLVEGPLHPPLCGRLAIVRDLESAHVWLLEHGLVTGHITVPEAPNLEAAVELGSEQLHLSAARLREMIQPEVSRIVEQGTALLVQLARRGQMPESTRSRVARLVLQAAKKGLSTDAISTVPVFRVVDDDGHRTTDLETLRRLARRSSGGDVLVALYPTQRPEKFTLGSAPVLIADASERSRLAELLHVRFRPPDPRDTASSLGLAWRRTLDGLQRAVRVTADWIRHPVHAKAIADHELSTAELHFVERIRADLAADPRLRIVDARICRGAGPIRCTRGSASVLLLPRENTVVSASIAAIVRDPTWTYPVTLALLDGRRMPPATSRLAWLRGRDSQPA